MIYGGIRNLQPYTCTLNVYGAVALVIEYTEAEWNRIAAGPWFTTDEI
jgi:hypothetical protein